MAKTRDLNIPQHHLQQGHYGDLSLDELPDASGYPSGTTNIWDGSSWFLGEGQAGGSGSSTDELVKVSSNDTTSDYLGTKLVAGAHVTILENNDGSNETLTISSVISGSSNVPDLINSTKASADTPDDEFPTSSLDAKWTVVDGSSGTVGLIDGSGAGVYDLSTRPGWLLMKVGTAVDDSVVLRQDYTLPDGKCIVAAVTFASDQQTTQSANNEISLGIVLNDNDTGPTSSTAGQTLHCYVDSEASGQIRVIGYDGTTILGETATATTFAGLTFVRIDRSGLVYRAFYSHSGWGWTYLGSKTMGSAANNIWLYGRCTATMANRVVVGAKWIRQGTALAIDPWPIN